MTEYPTKLTNYISVLMNCTAAWVKKKSVYQGKCLEVLFQRV